MNHNLDSEVAQFRWLLDGLRFEPKDDSTIYLHWEGLSFNNCWCEGSAQEVSPVPRGAQWVPCCCRGWLLPGPAAQLSLPHFHRSTSAHGWLRCHWDRKQKSFPKLPGKLACHCFPGVTVRWERKQRDGAAFEQVSIIAYVKKKKKTLDKGGEWFSVTAHEQELGTTMFSLPCPCTWCR